MKGSYILVIFIQKNIELIIGALGNILFKEGYYFYVGSAMGNSGSTTLINRIKRHVFPLENKKIHWHIDYLLKSNDAFICSLYLIPSLQSLECLLASELLKSSDGYVDNFGSSDCNCKSHLFYNEQFKSLDKVFR
ncbi:MAG: DUF123 domain-containing protein [Promethearchaeota archaeon]